METTLRGENIETSSIPLSGLISVWFFDDSAEKVAFPRKSQADAARKKINFN
jgi:hypothetical protein